MRLQKDLDGRFQSHRFRKCVTALCRRKSAWRTIPGIVLYFALLYGGVYDNSLAI